MPQILHMHLKSHSLSDMWQVLVELPELGSVSSEGS